MIEPFVALGVFAGISFINNIIRTLLTRNRHVATTVVVKDARLLLKDYSDPEQWFAAVWKAMNANKLDVSDEVIQEIFTAKGKGRAAQIVLYHKYGGVTSEK